MKTISGVICALGMAFASPAWAEFTKVDSQAAFVSLVGGKTLTRPLVKLQVLPDGRIAGKGAAWSVSGDWQWKGSYFCRTLVWGGDNLGYNCQEVAVDGTRIRFTSDQGTGDSAEFRLR